MSDPAHPGSDAGRRSLDRDLIVTAAIAAIDARGVHALTMRQLGQDLGVEAMSLYHYVTGREDLLEAVVEQVLAPVMGRVADGPIDSWQGYLQTMAHEVRRVALAHPEIFPLAATRHPAAPWLRPPLRSIALVEHFLASLTERGLDDEAAVAVYKVFTTFLLGALLLEAASRQVSTAPLDEPLDEGGAMVPGTDAGLDLDGAPHVVRMRRLLSRDENDSEFELGLETLLDRIERSLSQ